MATPLQTAFRALCVSLGLPLAMFVAGEALPRPPTLSIAHNASLNPESEPASDRLPTKTSRSKQSKPENASAAATRHLQPKTTAPANATQALPDASAIEAEDLAIKLSRVEAQLRTMESDHRREVARLEQMRSQHELERQIPLPTPTQTTTETPTKPAPTQPPAPSSPMKPPPPKPIPNVAAPAPPSPKQTNAERLASRGIRNVRAEEGRFTMQLYEADLGEVLTLLGELSHRSIVAARGVSGRVTATLTEADLEQALDALLRTDDFVTRTTNNAIVVLTRADAERRDRDSQPLETRMYVARYLNAADLRQLVAPFLTPGLGRVDMAPAPTASTETVLQRQQAVVVQDHLNVLEHVDRIVQELDVPPQQVILDVMLIRVELSNQHQMGVDFDTLAGVQQDKLISPLGSPYDTERQRQQAEAPLGSSTGKSGLLRTTKEELLKRLQQIGPTTVVASPSLVVLSKEQADLTIQKAVGRSAGPYGATQMEIGSQLRLRPDVGAEGLIKLSVQPEHFGMPQAEVSAQFETLLHDNQTLVLGGLFDQTREPARVRNISDLFKGKGLFDRRPVVRRWEMLTLITPRLVRDLDRASTSLGKPTLLPSGVYSGKPFAVTATRFRGPDTRDDMIIERLTDEDKVNPMPSNQQPWEHSPRRLLLETQANAKSAKPVKIGEGPAVRTTKSAAEARRPGNDANRLKGTNVKPASATLVPPASAPRRR